MTELSNKEVIAERKYMARLMSVQALYSQDVMGDSRQEWSFDSLNDELIKFFHDHARGEESNKKIDKKLFKIITEGASKQASILDEAILKHFDDDWNMQRVGSLLMSILRAGSFEIINYNTPAKIVITQYSSIAADFFDETEVAFVNAVLDKIAREEGSQDVIDLPESLPKELKYQKKAPVVVLNKKAEDIISVGESKLTLSPKD